MKIINNRGEDQAGGGYDALQQRINEMLESCQAVKGEQFANVVAAQHALLQLPTVMHAMYLAGARDDEVARDVMVQTYISLSISIARALAGATSEADMNEAFKLSSDFIRHQTALTGKL